MVIPRNCSYRLQDSGIMSWIKITALWTQVAAQAQAFIKSLMKPGNINRTDTNECSAWEHLRINTDKSEILCALLCYPFRNITCMFNCTAFIM